MERLDSLIYKDSQDYKDIRAELSQQIFLIDDFTEILNKAGVRTTYYRNRNGLPRKTITKIIKTVILHRNELLAKLKSCPTEQD